MLWEERIRQAMIDMASRHGPAQIVTGTVTAVDESAETCEVTTADGKELDEVRLRATIDETERKGWVLLPVVGSDVLVGNIENGSEWCILMVSEVAKIHSEVGNMVVELDGEKIQISNEQESLGGLLNDLISTIRQMVFVTPAGNTTALVNDPVFQALKTRFSNLLK
jgi:hypothetical protein